MDVKHENLMEKIVALCKRRGFIFPSSEIYGGMSNTFDYGPAGVELKNNIKKTWWRRFVQLRDDIVGLDAALVMNPKVWEASGHVANFTDPLVECKKCHGRFRADQLEGSNCPDCGAKDSFTEERTFNLMFKTFIGPAEESSNVAYFRPETAQAMFVDFKNVIDTTRVSLPFGIAQIGKAFRNEITPGNFIFRTREFEQMEIEYFINPPENDLAWQKHFEDWRQEMLGWMGGDLGLNLEKVHELEVPESGRAHYSKRTIDFEYDFPFGRKELYGLAYRTDFDLKNHDSSSGQNIKYKNLQTGEEFWPHVIEPTWGVDRTVMAVLANAYTEEEIKGRTRIVLKIKPSLAPFKAAVFPLVGNKPEIVEAARKVHLDLKKDFMVTWDDRGNIGGRYASQDEIGTPFCITVDYQTLEDQTVTIRDRDTTEQIRVGVGELKDYLNSKINGQDKTTASS